MLPGLLSGNLGQNGMGGVILSSVVRARNCWKGFARDGRNTAWADVCIVLAEASVQFRICNMRMIQCLIQKSLGVR